MDFHCHLDLYPNAREVYAEACARNAFTWLVTTSPKAYAATSRVLGRSPRVMITPGLHPEVAHERVGELELLLEQIAEAPAVGEVGLDGSPRYQSGYAIQQRVFRSVLKRCAALGGRTLSIHSRLAATDVLAELQASTGYGTAVLHWFTGSSAELRLAVENGCWFSIGPGAFASANGRSIAAMLPRDRVVPESDGPFAKLAGKPVMPWSEAETANLLGRAWSVPLDEVRTVLAENSHRLLAQMRSAA